MTSTPEPTPRSAEVAVVGGGLAGLAAAALIARGGRSVVVLEQSGHLGGRAATHVRQDARFNLGPHALYVEGPAMRLLRDLGVPFTGRVPRSRGALGVAGETPFPLPVSVGSLLGTRLLTLREKWRLARIQVALPRLDTRRLDRVPLGDWLEKTAGTGRLAELLRAFFRLVSYADDPARMSAGAAIDQLRSALTGNVWYIDGGWQTLVDGLRDEARGAGAVVRTGATVESVQSDGEEVAVQLAGGDRLRCRVAILGVGPREACELLELPADSSLARWTATQHPVQAACLDVALDRLPRSDRFFALGVDRPFYYSVHSATARLAPDGVAVLHVLKYLGRESGASTRAVEQELEAFLELLQPGWQSHVRARRFLPSMSVAHALPRADEGGLSGRPGVTVAERLGVYLAGDWVGNEGMLADAAAASAAAAAGQALAALGRTLARHERSPSHVAG
jgi:phytoene dehydrogenase-like protein